MSLRTQKNKFIYPFGLCVYLVYKFILFFEKHRLFSLSGKKRGGIFTT